MYDVFFIEYGEPNAEENWNQLLTFHPTAKKISNIKGIDIAHLMCNDLATTDKFWTVDGDNWVLRKLELSIEFNVDLIMFDSLDSIDKGLSVLGSTKLWSKNKFINTDMSKGDFTLNATKTYKTIKRTMSENRYNITPYSTWKFCFRHMVKSYSGIINIKVLKQNIRKYQRFPKLDNGTNNAVWGYRASLDAKKYVEQCNGDFNKINLINNYDWLETKFNVCAEDWQKL
jgi:hypothetical protein